MANMEYCRFENTLRDLMDCHNHLLEEAPNESEAKAKEQLIKVCMAIAYDFTQTHR